MVPLLQARDRGVVKAMAISFGIRKKSYSKREKLACKIMVIIFLDRKGVLLINFMFEEQS